MKEQVSNTLRAVTLGLLLGAGFAIVTAVLERDVFIPVSGVTAVVSAVVMVLLAAVLAFFRSRRPIATSLFIVAIIMFAAFYAAMSMMGR